MDLQLDDKVVLVTGAASGIGAATARAFARAGGRLGLVDRDREGLDALATELRDRTKVVTAVADLATAEGVTDGVGALLAAYRRADVLVNNVGGGITARSFDQVSDADWQATFELNLMSAVRACRLVLPGMRTHGGVVTTISSDLARQPEPHSADYAAAKAALLALVKTLAAEHGPAVRVNAVAPGPIWTPLWSRPGGLAEQLGHHHGLADPKTAVEAELARRHLPLRRLGRPDEVATVIVFLSSAAASYVTGSVYGADGGSLRGI